MSVPLQHEERLSRVFDEVMGLGDFADSSRGSAASSKSGGQDETKGEDKTSGQEEHQQAEAEREEVEEDDSSGSRQEEKMDEGMGEPPFPRISSASSDQNSLFTVETNEGAGAGAGRSGGAAFDDALDGMEDDEDWHFALPMGSIDEVHMAETSRKKSQPAAGNKVTPVDPFAHQPREEEEEEEEQEQEREASSESTNTSHSSQDHTPDNSQGKNTNLDYFKRRYSLPVQHYMYLNFVVSSWNINKAGQLMLVSYKGTHYQSNICILSK